ncbi:MAG: aconitate hydratase AcnA [Deltaproteobacteria bacterium]|nr:aconitate hydratase AcnA [Deltaproteobacteria bacterium]
MASPFDARTSLPTASGSVDIFSLRALEKAGLGEVSTLPVTLKVLLENLLRHCDGYHVGEDDVAYLAGWDPAAGEQREIAYMPARVLLQDFTGVPAVVDLAALRSAMARLGGDPKKINPLIPADLVIDHSVQVDRFGTEDSFGFNARREFERNRERYEFLKWGQMAFDNFRVVPPATGICHQVNLEYLGRVVQTRDGVAFPDTLVGTDSHTTMINGLGILGWGVGGIEAEAVMLGQPVYMLVPRVVGVRLTGELRPGVTATDLVLRVTELLREHGVVGKLVEYFGDGVGGLSLPDRAVLANMAPEYGATAGFFPVDAGTLEYLRFTGRDEALVDLVERYTKEQGLFRSDDAPALRYSEVVELDLAAVEPAIAGPKRPQDRIPLGRVKRAFFDALRTTFSKGVETDLPEGEEAGRWADEGGNPSDGQVVPAPRRHDTYSDQRVRVDLDGVEASLTHGAVVIASITSCTNTSSPTLMLGAGLLAKKAVERGLTVRPWVKTSLAPGSRVVTRYLEAAGLLPYLEALRFHLVGYGCATCIGNSGPLPEPVARAVTENDLVVAGVLSGNRNFEGRINPLVKANYLASPPLVVAYALAGTVDIDLTREPIAHDPNGQPVYLRDLWPSDGEVREAAARAVSAGMFGEEYAKVFEGTELWNGIEARGAELYAWDPTSTYIQEPPFFQDLTLDPPGVRPIENARALAVLGDSVTTDHISPAGAFGPDTPAGRYLIEKGVAPEEFNSFGSRRGNHEVMMRGTFGNVRIRNRLAPGTEGGFTTHLPTGEVLPIYDAAMRYRDEGTPLVVLAGKDYGMGSSRDWAAKGTALLGVRAVIAESYERIHRSNLVGMGVLPLQFQPGDSVESLGLTGRETFTVEGLDDRLRPGQTLTVRARAEDGGEKTFPALVRIDTPVEMEYYRNGGILHTVLRRLAREG